MNAFKCITREFVLLFLGSYTFKYGKFDENNLTPTQDLKSRTVYRYLWQLLCCISKKKRNLITLPNLLH